MRTFRLSALVLLAALSWYAQSFAAETTIRIPTREKGRIDSLVWHEPDAPRMALALSGGGFRGLAHIGVLDVLEEEGIIPDAVAGVSFGALVGGLYCEGLTPDEIFQIFRNLKIEHLLMDRPERRSQILARKQELSRHMVEFRVERGFKPVLPGAVLPGQILYQRLIEQTLNLPNLPVSDWNNLNIPLRMLSVDLQSGAPVVFTHGDPAIAIRASMSAPLLIDPLTIDTLQLIDGGIAANIPVDLARSMNADIVLAVDVSAELQPLKPPFQPWRIVDQVTTILEQASEADALANADVIVTPIMPSDTIMNTLEYNFEVVEAGRQAMRKALPELREKLKNLEARPDTTVYVVAQAFERTSYTGCETKLPMEKTVTSEFIERRLRQTLERRNVRDAFAVYNDETRTLTFHTVATTMLWEVQVNGNIKVSDADIFQCFSGSFGKALNLDALDHAIKCVHQLYRQRGYPLAQSEAVSFDPNLGAIFLKVNEGFLDKIALSGLNAIREQDVGKELSIHSGDVINRKNIINDTKKLYATGMFRSVLPQIVASDERAGYWDIIYHFQEQPPPVRIGLAYQAERRTRGFVEYNSSAWQGFLLRAVIFSSVGEKDDDHRISYHVDKVYGKPIIADLTFGFMDRERYSYNLDHERIADYYESKWGAQVEVGGMAQSWGLFALTARWEKHWNRYVDRLERYQISALGFKLGLDTQDRDPYPRRGFKVSGYGESAGKYSASDVSFNHIWGEGEVYLPLHRRYTFAMRLSSGSADRTTPRDEMFRLGGIHSFPGLHLDEKIGMMQTTAGAELRFDLLSKLLADAYFGGRFDVGGNWADPEAQIKRNDWMTSASVYFALDTILGPIHVQWGHLFNSPATPENNVFYIQAGNIF